MSKVVRSVKNVTKGYSSVQVKVRNATSNDPWGPTGTDMTDIARMTYNGSNDFYEIMDMLDKRLNDKGKNWRHVLKSLKVLDYCLHEGSELVVTWARKNVYIIKTLREFQYIDDDGRDVGQNVRVSAKELSSLIMDEDRLRTERSDRKNWKSRVTGIDEFGSSDPTGFGEPSHRQRPPRRRANSDDDDNDAEYRLALEASKFEAQEEERRRNGTSRGNGPDASANDEDLAKAIRLSKEEEELRKRELEESNAAALFDVSDSSATVLPQQQQSQMMPQYTGYNQGYRQQGQVDFFGNPIPTGQGQGHQMQNTGYLDNMYSQQPQMTGYGAGFQAQQTGFDQSQQGYYQGHFVPNGNQQQQQQQQPLAPAQTGSLNPWASGSTSAEPLKPMPTGSNNPFAQNRPPPQTKHDIPPVPSLNSLAAQKTATPFNSTSTIAPNPIANYPVLTQSVNMNEKTNTPARPAMNPQHERLNALLASGEGMDTFGNTGDLRIPAQHTAPGTFVNSAGQGLNRLNATQTGNNPFFNQQQFTGSPQRGYPGSIAAQVPAQTGPAGSFGQNPYSAGHAQSQLSHGGMSQQSSSLIDL